MATISSVEAVSVSVEQTDAVADVIDLAQTEVKDVVTDIDLAQTEVQDFTSDLLGTVTGGVIGTKSATTKKDDDPYGIGEFFIGCILIPFSIVFLWKNEKKLVTYAKLVHAAEEACEKVDCNYPKPGNKLVHTFGNSVNKTDLVDNDFQVSVSNSYRLIRTVEMYQWQQTVTKGQDGRPDEYHYSQGWFEHPIDSSGFANQTH